MTQNLNKLLEPFLLCYNSCWFAISNHGLLLSLGLLVLAGGGYWIRLKYSPYGGTNAEPVPNLNRYLQPSPKTHVALNVVMPTKPPSFPSLREYNTAELRALFQAGNLKSRQLFCLLLSGLTLDETASLRADQVDLEMSTITVFGNVLRAITMVQPLKGLLAQGGPVWDNIKPMSFAEMNDALYQSALQAGLDTPKTSIADTLRHTYIMHLLKQGMAISQLRWVVGYIEPGHLAFYQSLASEQQPAALQTMNLTHPVFAELAF